MHEIKEVKGKLQVVLTLEEANNPRKKQLLIISNANQIEKLKAMHENFKKKFFTQNASKILKNKDGKGSVYIQQIRENLEKRKEDKALENKATQETNSLTKDLGNLFQQHLTKKDPPNQ
ncbi:hypothetical protein HpHA293_14780 [Helicobacter pylori]